MPRHWLTCSSAQDRNEMLVVLMGQRFSEASGWKLGETKISRPYYHYYLQTTPPADMIQWGIGEQEPTCRCYVCQERPTYTNIVYAYNFTDRAITYSQTNQSYLSHISSCLHIILTTRVTSDNQLNTRLLVPCTTVHTTVLGSLGQLSLPSLWGR